jgi:hypothetical protein
MLEIDAKMTSSESEMRRYRRIFEEIMATHEETANQFVRWSHLRSQWIAVVIRGIVVRSRKRKWT